MPAQCSVLRIHKQLSILEAIALVSADTRLLALMLFAKRAGSV